MLIEISVKEVLDVNFRRLRSSYKLFNYYLKEKRLEDAQVYINRFDTGLSFIHGFGGCIYDTPAWHYWRKFSRKADKVLDKMYERFYMAQMENEK